MFAREGAQIGVADIDPESAAKVMGEIRDQGGSARPIILDVADSAAVAKAYSELLAAFGQIDISVHYAGLRQTWPAIT
jgi:NAD(P)-dependent dehydrogenase (short-subunit alcohol dehydrogenase family)